MKTHGLFFPVLIAGIFLLQASALPVRGDNTANPGFGLSPVSPQPQSLPPYSIDSPANRPSDPMVYTPYNDGFTELDLWTLEAKRFIRSRPVVSPDKNQMAYTEVIYMPHNRQTFSKLYLSPIEPPPSNEENIYQQLPEEQYKQKAASKDSEKTAAETGPTPAEIEAAKKRLDPNSALKQRRPILGVGSNRTAGHEFRTLTVIDWSASGERLLFKQRSGVMHLGLKTSDILVYDKDDGTIALYAEIQNVISHHWRQMGTVADLDTLAWDIYPLGWEPGSNHIFLLKAWAYDKNSKKFLGLWKYDIDAERAELVSLSDGMVSVAANGFLAAPPAPAQ